MGTRVVIPRDLLDEVDQFVGPRRAGGSWVAGGGTNPWLGNHDRRRVGSRTADG